MKFPIETGTVDGEASPRMGLRISPRPLSEFAAKPLNIIDQALALGQARNQVALKVATDLADAGVQFGEGTIQFRRESLPTNPLEE